MIEGDATGGQARFGRLDGGALLNQLKLVLLGGLFGLHELGLGRFKIGFGFLKAQSRQSIIQPNEDRACLDRLRFMYFNLDDSSG